MLLQLPAHHCSHQIKSAEEILQHVNEEKLLFPTSRCCSHQIKSAEEIVQYINKEKLLFPTKQMLII
jgi:hypothetical protein